MVTMEYEKNIRTGSTQETVVELHELWLKIGECAVNEMTGPHEIIISIKPIDVKGE